MGKRINTPPLPMGRARFLVKCQVNFGLSSPALGVPKSNLFQDLLVLPERVHEVQGDQING